MSPMLHPQTRALLELIEQRGLPPTHTLNPAEARASLGERFRVTQPPPPEVGRVQELKAGAPAGPIPLRLYRPIGASDTVVLPVLLYYHGGGFVLGDLDTHDTLCRELANLSGCAVIAVDYRLAPEHRFPAAVQDCIAAARWVSAHAAELGLDASRLAVGGDSAGGNLAAVVSIDAREAGNLPIAFQLLIYPATDMYCSARSHAENAQGYFLTRDTMDYFIGHYLGDPAHYGDWRASPLLHPRSRCAQRSCGGRWGPRRASHASLIEEGPVVEIRGASKALPTHSSSTRPSTWRAMFISRARSTASSVCAR